MRKDWSTWTVHINRHRINNWAIGVDYYHVNDNVNPLQWTMLARVLQINLLFFNITLTRWQGNQWR